MAERFDIFGVLDDVISARSEIADPNDNGIEAQIGRALCDNYASNPTAWAIGSISTGGSGGPGVAFEGLCRPYWDDQGDYPAPSEPAPPFTGGQCSCVIYSVDISYNIVFSDGSTAGPNSTGKDSVPGPIRSAGVDNETTIRVTWGDEACGGIQSQVVATGPGFEILSVDVTRDDGMPDDCGDLPDELPPPVAVPNPPVFGEPFDITDPVTGSPFPITISPPTPDGSGDVYVDIDSPIGPITFTPGGGKPDAGPPSKPTAEGPPINGGSDGDRDDEPETEDGTLIGYSWEFPNVPTNRGEIPLSNPRRFYPVIGGMQLKLESAEGAPYYGPQALIREQRGAILRPDPTIRVVGLTYTTDRLYNDVVIRTLRVREEV